MFSITGPIERMVGRIGTAIPGGGDIFGAARRSFAELGAFGRGAGEAATGLAQGAPACTAMTGALLDQSLVTALPAEVGTTALAARAYIDTTVGLGAYNAATLTTAAKALTLHGPALHALMDAGRGLDPSTPGYASARAAGIALVTRERAHALAQLVDPAIDPRVAVQVAGDFRVAVGGIPTFTPGDRAYQAFVTDHMDTMAAQAVTRAEAHLAVVPPLAAQSVDHPFNPNDPRPSPARPEFDQFRRSFLDPEGTFLAIPDDHPIMVANRAMVEELRDQVETVIGPIEWNGTIEVMNGAHFSVRSTTNAAKTADCAIQIHEKWADHPARATFLFHELMHGRSMLVSDAGPQLLTYMAAPGFEEGIVEGLLQAHIGGVLNKLSASDRALFFQGETIADVLGGRAMYEAEMHAATGKTYEPWQRMEKIRAAFAVLHPEFAGLPSSEGAAGFYQLLMNTPAQQRLKLMQEIHNEIIDKLPMTPERGAAAHAYSDLINLDPGLTRHGQLIAMDKMTFNQRVVEVYRQTPELGPAPDILNYPAPNQPIRHPSADKPSAVVAPGALPPILPPDVTYEPWFPATSAKPSPDPDVEMVRRLFAPAAQGGGGFTYDPRTNKFITKGLAYSPYPEHNTVLTISGTTKKAMREFREKHAELLKQPGTHVGGWFNEGAHRIELDISVVHPEAGMETALEQALLHGQEGIYNIRTFTNVPVMSGDQRRRWDVMFPAERETWAAMTHAERVAWIEGATPLPDPLQIEQLVQELHRQVEKNVGEKFVDRMAKSEWQETLAAVNDRLAPMGLSLPKKTTQKTIRAEVEKLNAIIKKQNALNKKLGEAAFGKTIAFDTKEGIVNEVKYRLAAVERYSKAMEDILGTHGVHVEEAKQWAEFYLRSSNLLARLAEKKEVDFPIVAAVAAALSPSERWHEILEGIKGAVTESTASHNVGMLIKILNDWKKFGEVGRPYRNAAGVIVNAPGLPGPFQTHYGFSGELARLLAGVTKELGKQEHMFRLEGTLQGASARKTNNFWRNLLGVKNSWTADRHANALGLPEDLWELVFNKKTGKWRRDPAVVGDARYNALEAAGRRLADLMGMDLNAVQAILWAFQKDIVSNAARGRTQSRIQRRIEARARRKAAGLPNPGDPDWYLSEEADEPDWYLSEEDTSPAPPEPDWIDENFDPVQHVFDVMERLDIDEMMDYLLYRAETMKQPEGALA